MKIQESLEIIDAGWIRKPSGFRVSYLEDGPTGLVRGLVPGEGDSPLDSDVTAWRLAWKIAQVNLEDAPSPRSRYRDVHVVDGQGQAIRYYVKNDFHIFNPTPGAAGTAPDVGPGEKDEV